MSETVPTNRRVYGVIEQGAAGKIVLRLTATPPDVSKAMGVLLWRGEIMDGAALELNLVSDAVEDPAVKALKSATLLGIITLAQRATVAVAAGMRTIIVTVPASMGMKAGEPIIAVPTVRTAGYAIHDAVAISPTEVSVTMTAPALAVNQSYSLPCKLIRLNI